MYRHLVNKIYHSVMHTLLPIDYVGYTTANQRPELTLCTQKIGRFCTRLSVHSNSLSQKNGD